MVGAPAVPLWVLGRPGMRWPTGDEARAWIAEPLTPGFLAVLGIMAGWALWALLATTVLTGLYDRAGRRLRWVAQVRLPGPLQGLTAALLGATAVTAGVGGTASAALAATAADPTDRPALPPADSDRPARAGQTLAQPDDGDATQRRTVTVRRGDSLSRIAARRLDDADRWRDIYTLNRGTRFDTGALTDPDLIRPGWRLRLPVAANTPPPPPAPASPPRAEPGPGHHIDPPASAPNDGADSSSPTPDIAEAPVAPGNGSSPACARPGVSLGDRGWVDAALAAAVLTAVALAWTRRQRRHTHHASAPNGQRQDPDPATVPPVVTRIRRALRQQTPPAPAVINAVPDSTSQPAPDTPTRPVDSLVTPALASPTIDVCPPEGLGLTGPGAQGAARGILVSALAADSPEEPHRLGHVVIPAAVLATLTGTAVTVATPRLTVAGGLTDALAFLEEQILHRTRLCFDHEVDTVAGLRDGASSVEPLPPVVLIADVTAAHERARISALLAQGQRLDIHGVLLGVWPDGDSVAVAEDGTTSPAADGAPRHGRHAADIGRLTVLDPTDTAELLRVLAEAHTGQPPAPAVAAPIPQADARHRDDLSSTGDASPDDENGGGLALGPAVPDHEPEPVPVTADGLPVEQPQPPVRHQLPAGETDDARGTEPSDEGDRDEDAGTPPLGAAVARVEVRVLGDARVVDVDATQPLRAKSLELLVYLAVRGGTASQEAILEDLLPEATTSKAPHRLHTYVYNLRRVLKHTGGPAIYLSHPDRRYVLHRDTLDVDLWRMTDALDQADRATTATERITALRRAVDAYQGPLAGGKSYEWLGPYREAIRRQAADAALALADALHDQPAEALAVLTTAIGLHPYAEPLYQAAMRVHAALDDAAAIRDLHRQLARALREIDTEVSDDTTTLAATLTARLRRTRPSTNGQG
ncbi:BTAD domain-containing putative transcriptional regulator [Micromonospora fluostatini]|uniref:BTAD domain-containing putative transcriptional regulator n=1 Tax=Micromonospora sp. JCM 30529 TaxID=3421643 RepID=UPI003D1690AA